MSRALQRTRAAEIDAEGVAANFSCGSYVKYYLEVDDAGKILAADISSNGCGYMVAAADLLAEYVSGRDLRELHGLRGSELRSLIIEDQGELPADRKDCAWSSIEALTSAFSDLRSRRIEEFRGDKALICTCFGVSEEQIETLIGSQKLETVEDVAMACNAGSGCGSCRMLIQELLDLDDSIQPGRT